MALMRETGLFRHPHHPSGPFRPGQCNLDAGVDATEGARIRPHPGNGAVRLDGGLVMAISPHIDEGLLRARSGPPETWVRDDGSLHRPALRPNQSSKINFRGLYNRGPLDQFTVYEFCEIR